MNGGGGINEKEKSLVTNNYEMLYSKKIQTMLTKKDEEVVEKRINQKKICNISCSFRFTQTFSAHKHNTKFLEMWWVFGVNLF